MAPTPIALLLLAATALAGCSTARNIAGAVTPAASAKGPNSVTINDTRFRSRLQIDGPEKRELTITVSPVAQDPEAAQEAGRYRATYYCLRRFGSSETDWLVGPDVPVEELAISGDSITLEGRCAAR